MLLIPIRTSPPTRSAPEARHLPFMNYTNEWDKQPEQSKMPLISAPMPPPGRARRQVNEKVQEPAKEPEMKPIFPWEKKPRRTSRVFADEIPILDEDEDDEAPEDAVDDTDQDGEEWKDYTRENQWDSVPGIQEYVSDLKRHRTHNFPSAESGPLIAGKYNPEVAVVDERPPLPVTPAPIRRTGPHWLSGEDDEKFPSAAGIPSQEDWVCNVDSWADTQTASFCD